MTELRKTIAVLPGDGIGPEVTRAAIQILTDCAALLTTNSNSASCRLAATPSIAPVRPSRRNARRMPLRRRNFPGRHRRPEMGVHAAGNAPRGRLARVATGTRALTSISGRPSCVPLWREFLRCVPSGWLTAISKLFANSQETSTSASTKSKKIGRGYRQIYRGGNRARGPLRIRACPFPQA